MHKSGQLASFYTEGFHGFFSAATLDSWNKIGEIGEIVHDDLVKILTRSWRNAAVKMSRLTLDPEFDSVVSFIFVIDLVVTDLSCNCQVPFVSTFHIFHL